MTGSIGIPPAGGRADGENGNLQDTPGGAVRHEKAGIRTIDVNPEKKRVGKSKGVRNAL
jgi:hypothetical protein